MLNMNWLCRAMEGSVLSAHVHREISGFDTFELLGEESRFSPEQGTRTLYLATPGNFCAAADRVPEGTQTYTVLIAGSSPALAAYLDRDRFDLFVVGMSLTELCNCVIRAGHAYDSWRAGMERYLYAEASLGDLLAAGAAVLPADILYLDVGYRVISAARSAGCPLLAKAEEDGQLSDEQIRVSSDALWWEQEGWRLTLRPITADRQLVGYLYVGVSDAVSPPLAAEVTEETAEFLQTFMARYYRDRYASSNLLNVFMCDLLDGKLSDSEELLSRARQLPLRLKSMYYCLIVVTPSDPSMSRSPHLISALSQLCATDTVTTYHEDILVLNYQKERNGLAAIDWEGLTQLMEQYDSVACVSNNTQWLSSLRPLYIQTKGVIPFARLYCQNKQRRVFQSEDYAMYQIVDLCARYCRDYFHDDLRYLCHSGIVRLHRHDRKRQTNYCDILEYYLLHDRKLTQTAQEFYIHRNTLQSKLEKISEIVGEDFEKPQIRQRLLFSLQVIRYMQLYLKRENVYGDKQNAPATFNLLTDQPLPAVPL